MSLNGIDMTLYHFDNKLTQKREFERFSSTLSDLSLRALLRCYIVPGRLDLPKQFDQDQLLREG